MPATATAPILDRPTVFPCLFYRDAPAAIDWLCRAFGFERGMMVPGENGRVLHAQLRQGNSTIMLGSTDASRGFDSPRDLTGINQSICVLISDPDAHYARAKEAGAEIFLDIADTDYGARGYTARDLEGHVWTFSTYDPIASP